MIPPSTLAVGPAVAALNVDDDDDDEAIGGDGWTIVDEDGSAIPGVTGAGRESAGYGEITDVGWSSHGIADIGPESVGISFTVCDDCHGCADVVKVVREGGAV
jgi:hypothetical protein